MLTINSVTTNDCPECDSDLITVESSISLEVSIISCDDCDFRIEDKCNEDDLIDVWNNMYRREK